MSGARRGPVRAALVSLRPVHWLKNLPVGAGLLFGGRIGDRAAALSTSIAFAAFCAVASAGYLANDAVDAAADREHPTRRLRPIAARELSARAALLLAIALGGGALVVAFAVLPMPAALGLLGYAFLTVSYSLAWKRVAALAPPVLAAGFVLRVLVGAFAAGVEPSTWLLVLTATLALGLAIAKRESEARRETGGAPARLRLATDACLLASAVGYVAYTLWPGTVALHGTRLLVVTSPPVAAALWRFRVVLRRDATGAGPISLVARDPAILALGAAWVALSVCLLALRG